MSMAIDFTGTLVATGSSDNTVKVWDIEQGHLTHNLTGHTGVVLCVAFHPNPGRLQLFSGSEDQTVRAWDLNTSVYVLSLWLIYPALPSLMHSFAVQRRAARKPHGRRHFAGLLREWLAARQRRSRQRDEHVEPSQQLPHQDGARVRGAYNHHLACMSICECRALGCRPTAWECPCREGPDLCLSVAMVSHCNVPPRR